MADASALIFNIFNYVRESKFVKMAFYKSFLLAFSILLLPYIIIYCFLVFKRFFLPILWAFVEPFINQVIPQSFNITFSGFGGWLANSLHLVECTTVILSAFCSSFVIRFIKSR